MSEIVLRVLSGRQPEETVLKIRDSLQPRESDLLFAGIQQRTRILQRTAAGKDVDGNAFAPYSTKGPYYFRAFDRPGLGKGNVHERRAKVPEVSRIRSAHSFLRRLGGSNGTLKFRGETIASISTREKDTIKFASYAAFKSALGRSGVDLTGPRAPHMLQAIQVRAGGSRAGSNDTSGGSDSPANEFTIGIYGGEKAAIASGHNEGTSRLPRRKFMGTSASDAKQMLIDIYHRMMHRGKQ